MAGLALALGALNGPAALKSPAALLSIAKTKTAGRSLHGGSDGPAQFAEPGFFEALTALGAHATPENCVAACGLELCMGALAEDESAQIAASCASPCLAFMVTTTELTAALDATHEHEEGSGDAAAAEEPLDLSLVCSVYNGCGASFFNGVFVNFAEQTEEEVAASVLANIGTICAATSCVRRRPAIPRARPAGAPPAPRRRPPPAQTAAMDFAINLADGGAGGGSVATGMCDCRAACGLGDYKNDMSICTAASSADPLAAMQAGSAKYPDGYIVEVCGNALFPECGEYMDSFNEDGSTPISDFCNVQRLLPTLVRRRRRQPTAPRAAHRAPPRARPPSLSRVGRSPQPSPSSSSSSCAASAASCTAAASEARRSRATPATASAAGRRRRGRA